MGTQACVMICRDREGQVLETLPDIALILVGALWLVGGCALGLGWLKFEGLERASAGVVADKLSPPLVSVIIPARDEAASIGRTLEQLSRATYQRLEVIVVDDRSRDATGSIARSVATSWDRIQVLEIDRLAQGWLGKPYALKRGFEHSRGEWLCFVDADVHLEPTCIEKAVRLAEARGLDHLSVFPTMVVDGVLETAFVMTFAFYFGAFVQPWKAKRADSAKFCGVGAFNLVRRDAYEAIGTHKRLRLEIADDIKLGKLIKQAGLRQDAVDGDGLLSVQWQRGGIGAYVRGLEKNAFAGLDFSIPKVLMATTGVVAMSILPFAGILVADGYGRKGAALSIAVIAIGHGVIARYMRVGTLHFLLHPIAAAVMVWSIWRSTLLALWRGSVSWRGRDYPLSLLRKHLV